MKLRALLVALVAFACSAGACSLNPQPLPPGQYDAATTGSPDAGSGYDSGAFGDGGVPTSEDAGSDAREDASDAETDAGASDAETDAGASDAETDAVADAPSD